MTQKKTLKLPKLIGHRGVKDLCPENTLESILKAFDLGLSFVEIDVKISKDRVPILLHDDTLDRTTNGSGLAIDYDYENIKKLDAGKFFYKENTNIFVPKLEDILSLCTNYNGNLNIELKPNKKFEKENVYQIYKITKNINQIDIFFSSFDMISILEISKLYPQSIRSFLLDDFKEYNIDYVSSLTDCDLEGT